MAQCDRAVIASAIPPNAMVPPGFSMTCICRSAATGSGQICIELIANARRGLSREQLNANTGSETDFQYSVARLNIQQFDNARSDRSIGPGHYEATELPQDPLRATERAHRQALQRTRPPAHPLLHPQCVC